MKIDTECNKANKIVKWVLISMGLYQVFFFCMGFGWGLMDLILGH